MNLIIRYYNLFYFYCNYVEKPFLKVNLHLNNSTQKAHNSQLNKQKMHFHCSLLPHYKHYSTLKKHYKQNRKDKDIKIYRLIQFDIMVENENGFVTIQVWWVWYALIQWNVKPQKCFWLLYESETKTFEPKISFQIDCNQLNRLKLPYVWYIPMKSNSIHIPSLPYCHIRQSEYYISAWNRHLNVKYIHLVCEN